MPHSTTEYRSGRERSYDFVEARYTLIIIEQNRDAQFKSLLMIELGTDAAKLVSVLNYVTFLKRVTRNTPLRRLSKI